MVVSRIRHVPSSYGAYFLKSETEIVSIVTPRVCVLKGRQFSDNQTKEMTCSKRDRAGFLEKVRWNSGLKCEYFPAVSGKAAYAQTLWEEECNGQGNLRKWSEMTLEARGRGQTMNCMGHIGDLFSILERTGIQGRILGQRVGMGRGVNTVRR